MKEARLKCYILYVLFNILGLERPRYQKTLVFAIAYNARKGSDTKGLKELLGMIKYSVY